MPPNMTALGLDDTFQFSCSKEVPCFNECCQDLNQFLTPYDLMRLKNNLGISSTHFLEQYTQEHTGPESGLPMITLKPADNVTKVCPFVTPSGCRVYQDRPGSCRTYPLARLVSRSRETGNITEHYALMKESHCKGFEKGKSQTVREWTHDQGISEYNYMNDLLMEIISCKNRLKPDPLDITSRRLFHLACYDLDNFRTHIFKKGLLEKQDMDSDLMEHLKTNDTELLRFGLTWIKQALFSDINGTKS